MSVFSRPTRLMLADRRATVPAGDVVDLEFSGPPAAARARLSDGRVVDLLWSDAALHAGAFASAEPGTTAIILQSSAVGDEPEIREAELLGVVFWLGRSVPLTTCGLVSPDTFVATRQRGGVAVYSLPEGRRFPDEQAFARWASSCAAADALLPTPDPKAATGTTLH